MKAPTDPDSSRFTESLELELGQRAAHEQAAEAFLALWTPSAYAPFSGRAEGILCDRANGSRFEFKRAEEWRAA